MAKLGDVAQIVSGQSPPGNTYNETGAGLPFFQGKAEFGERHPIPVKWCTAPTKIAEAGDILMSVRAPVGPTNVADRRCCIGRGLAAIRPIPGVAEPDYVLWALASARPALEAKGNGSTFAAINRSDLASLDLPLPSLDEQRRIVDLLNRADAIRRLAEAAQAKARNLIPALFAEMFGDPATNSKGWPVKTIGGALTACDYGTSMKSQEDGQGIAVLRMGNVTMDGDLKLATLKYAPLEGEELERQRLKAGDILFNRTNSKELVGKTGLWDGRFEAVAASYFIRLRADPKQAHPTFIWAYLNSKALKRRLFEMARGAVGQSNINGKELRAIPLPLPPVELQALFAERVAEAVSQIEFAERAGRTAEALTQSIMAKVFAA